MGTADRGPGWGVRQGPREGDEKLVVTSYTVLVSARKWGPRKKHKEWRGESPNSLLEGSWVGTPDGGGGLKGGEKQ